MGPSSRKPKIIDSAPEYNDSFRSHTGAKENDYHDLGNRLGSCTKMSTREIVLTASLWARWSLIIQNVQSNPVANFSSLNNRQFINFTNQVLDMNIFETQNDTRQKDFRYWLKVRFLEVGFPNFYCRCSTCSSNREMTHQLYSESTTLNNNSIFCLNRKRPAWR